MAWFEALGSIEALEDAALDRALVARFERSAPLVRSREIRFSTPTFRAYSSCDIEGCGKNSFPAFSVTAGGCALMCDHCQAKILEPMIPATSPEMLERKVRALIATQDLQGFLVSGGSTRRNEIRYERYLPVVERLKREFPHLKIAVHSGFFQGGAAHAFRTSDGIAVFLCLNMDVQTEWDFPSLGEDIHDIIRRIPFENWDQDDHFTDVDPAWIW